MSFISLRNRYCLPDSRFIIVVTPEIVSRVTLAMLGIGFQPNLIGLSVVGCCLLAIVCWSYSANLPTTDNPRPTTHNLYYQAATKKSTLFKHMQLLG